jgi:HAD superfamily hydrolase (TIGR01509 family)
MTRIRHVVFDIGWVLLNLRTEPLLAMLSDRGLRHAGLEDVSARIALTDHESGRLDGNGLLDNLLALVPGRLTRDEAHAAWIDIFDPQPQMLALAQRLSQRYRVHLLSNVGDLHWAHITRRYRIHEIGAGYLQSFVAGVMKPHAQIYAQAESRFGLDPEATVFIDDRPENIAAAQARNWQGIVHSRAAESFAALEALGVDTR